jgi:hypothetical protein
MADENNNGLSSLSTYHMSANLEEYERARTGFFSFIVEDLDSLVKSDFNLDTPADSDIITNGQKVIEMTVVQCSVPHFSVEVLETRRGNSKIKFAGVPTFDDGTLVCEDYVGLDTKSVLMAWQNLTYYVTSDKGGRMSNWTDEDGVVHQGYKKNCTLIEYTQDHREIRHWDLIGCFPSKVEEDNFDKTSDGARKITMTISYDRAIMHLPD